MTKTQAETAYYEARAEEAREGARLAKVQRIAEELELKKARRSHTNDEADASEHRIFTFYDDVTDRSVSETLATLGDWARIKTAPITVIFNSPGGYCTDGLALYDFLRHLSDRGNKITTLAYGEVASMGGVLLQAGDVRVMARNAYLMIHEPASGAIGKTSAVKDKAKWLEQLWDHLVEILAERSTLSARQIKTKSDRRDWWLRATQAVELGFADEVR